MFKLRSKFMIIILLVFLPTCFVNAGDKIGEIGIHTGLNFPQGNFNSYADWGPSFIFRANTHIPKFEAVSGWFDISGALFSEGRESVSFDISNIIVDGDLVTRQYSISLHAGLQFGSGTRSGAIRPRAAIAPGIYYFSTETKFTRDLLGTEETLLLEKVDQVRFGWRGVLGTDIFLSTRWGISFDIVYDQVWNMHKVLAVNSAGQQVQRSQSARFNGYMIGVVIPFEAN